MRAVTLAMVVVVCAGTVRGQYVEWRSGQWPEYARWSMVIDQKPIFTLPLNGAFRENGEMTVTFPDPGVTVTLQNDMSVESGDLWTYTDSASTLDVRLWWRGLHFSVPIDIGGETRYTISDYDILRMAREFNRTTRDSSITFVSSGVRYDFYDSRPVPYSEDIDADGFVDANDAGLTFSSWGPLPLVYPHYTDANGDYIIDAADAGRIFAAWTGDVSAIPVPEPCSLPIVALAIASCRMLALRMTKSASST